MLRCLLVALACLGLGLPAQAAMVGTAQIHADPAALPQGDILAQREWIREQLIVGGVDEADAGMRVAAMTDSQVRQLHQRIDENPAGGNVLLWIVVILLITELTGVTDFVPSIGPND